MAHDAGAAARWGQQAANAMRMANPDKLIKPGVEPVGEVLPNERVDDWWYHAEQAVRCARIACYHAFKTHPKLRPMDSYEQAVHDHRQQHGTMAVHLGARTR